MKKIREYIKIYAVLFLLIPLFDSCNFLDVDDYFNETLKYDSIFKTKVNLEKFLWAAAASFSDEGAIFGNTTYTPGIMATDEAFSLGGAYNGLNLVLGRVSASNSYGIDIYENMYKTIRKANTILDRIDEVKDLTSVDRREIVGYTLFLRAYAYYNLLNLYGPVVLMDDDLLETNEEEEYYARYRNTYDECIEYICTELERAADYLPSDVPMTYFGRPQRGAALGLVARLRLQHASPLFNGGQEARISFGNFRRSSDNVHYIQQNYDEKRWAVAALASKRIIDMNIYKLHIIEKSTDTRPLPTTVPDAEFPNGAGNVDAYRSYSEMFNGEVLAARNPEFIWARNSGSVRAFTQRSFPVAIFRGFNNLCVTQKIVDAYYMEDGRTKEEATPDGFYSENGIVSGIRSFSGYQLGPNVHNMYYNREMRFYASVAFSGTWWTATSTSESAFKDKQIYYNYSDNGGKSSTGDDPNSYAITGYVLRKYIHPEDAWTGAGATVIDKPFPIIRYAEILLSYAEALNNLQESYTLTDVDGNEQTFERDKEQIKFYFNQVRYRAGLPGLTDAELADPAEVQRLIERERMLEFMCENRRFFDVRRWGKYIESEREPMMGMDTEVDGDGFYSRVLLNHSSARQRLAASADRKFIFMPIMLSELRRAHTLDQNPGWEN